MAALDLRLDCAALTVQLVDISSVSGTESTLADAIQSALAPVAHLTIDRDGDAIVARTDGGFRERVVVAGHIDTVPEGGNLPARRAGGVIHGLGSCDMKAGVAVALRLAATLTEPTRDVTYVFYDGEEIAEEFNGLKRLQARRPDLLVGDFAVLMEPSGGVVEAGCQGTIRVEVSTTGRRAHSARSWLGRNAIHELQDVLARLSAYQPRRVKIDGLEYREGLNAVLVHGGVAGNVIPDQAGVTVNYRFAPDRTLDAAHEHVRTVFSGYDVRFLDGAPGAMPGLDVPAAAAFVDAVGGQPKPKFGWTDVARFSALGVPAVNFGPGDPSLAHTREESVEESQIVACESAMRAWLTG